MRTGKKSEHSGTISKVASQQRRGFAEVRNRIVRGGNADSAEAWLAFGDVMFGRRAS